MAFNYEGCTETDINKVEKLYVVEDGQPGVKFPIRFNMQKPSDETGAPRDQTGEAAQHMRCAAALKLPELEMHPLPRMGRAVIVGGAPSIAQELETIKALAADPDNAVFALNWSHTWLLQNGIVPHGCVLFEIDAEPETMLKAAHPEVTYYICSHCHEDTFKQLAHCKRVLWHSPPNSEAEKQIAEELFSTSVRVGGGIGTFTRSLSLALVLGFRNLDLFGVDSSFPDDAKSTHVDGYETENCIDTDAFYVYAKYDQTNEVRRFKTVGYLALQVEEFKEYCRINHQMFALRVHGDGLLRHVHKLTYPGQYRD